MLERRCWGLISAVDCLWLILKIVLSCIQGRRNGIFELVPYFPNTHYLKMRLKEYGRIIITASVVEVEVGMGVLTHRN